MADNSIHPSDDDGQPYSYLVNKVLQVAASGHPKGDLMLQVLDEELSLRARGHATSDDGHEVNSASDLVNGEKGLHVPEAASDAIDESDGESPDSDDVDTSPAVFPPGQKAPSFVPIALGR